MSIHDHSVPRHPINTGIAWCVSIALLGLVAVSAALLLTDYRSQVLGALVGLPLLFCPLMHAVMHRHGTPRSDGQ